MIKKIFISYTGITGEALAERLSKLIRSAFNNQVTAYVASRAIGAGSFQQNLETELSNSQLLIVLFTPHDRVLKTDWKMYEAGFFRAIQKNQQQTNQHVINYAFCCYSSEIAAPLVIYNTYRYTYVDVSEGDNNYQRRHDENLTASYGLNDMMQAILKDLQLNLAWDDVNDRLYRSWDENARKDLAIIADEAIDLRKATAIDHNKSAYTGSNEHIDGTVFKTEGQLMYSTPSERGQKYTPRTLEGYFEKILDSFIPPNYSRDSQEFDGIESHTVRMGQTRISTFVAFTDGKDILLFDRAKANPNQKNVENNRYDVFGSVQFENRTIKRKIQSETFLDAPIQKLEPIYGAAFEDNHAYAIAQKQEVAVMFGVFAYMSSEDLNSALDVNDNGALFISPIAVVNSMTSDKFTSKAYLSIKQLSDL